MGHCSCCAHTNECAPEKHIEKKESIFAEYWKVGLSFILLISGIIMNSLELPFFLEGYFSLIWYIVAYLPVGLPVMKEAWESIKDKDYFSEFTLMFVATLGAFYIGEYPEGVAVMLFYSVGELFQEKAVDKAKRNIGALLDVRPEEAAVVRDGRVIIENPQNVKVGETIEIKTGGRVPLDGMMLNEVAAFNTAALTGESVPRSIRMGEEVLAGMIVTDKVIRIKVIRPFDKSALARILELVQNASERKAPAELFIRKFARVYTPIVIGLAVLIVLLPFIYSLITPQFLFTFNDWLYRALVFLVISCPCALVVSIPLGYFGGIGAASRLGILFKGGNYLDAITRVNTVVFDKTGTLVVATDEKVEATIKTGIALAKAAGYTGEYITDKDRIKEILPDISTDNILGAGYTQDDGYFDGTMISNTYAKKMQKNGGVIKTGVKVTEVLKEGNKIKGLKTDDGQDYEFDYVVDCTGPWSKFTGEMVGMDVPIWHTKAEAFFLCPPGKKLGYTFPVLKYPAFYALRAGDNIFICKSHLSMDLSNPMHAGQWDPDKLPATGGTDDYFIDFLLDQLECRVPGIVDSGLVSSWLSYRAEPKDFLPILGETPVEGYILATGYGRMEL